MPIKTACPDKSVLECYVLGQVPADERALLEQHLEQCSSCVEILHALHPSDPLVQTLRSGSPDQTVEEPQPLHPAGAEANAEDAYRTMVHAADAPPARTGSLKPAFAFLAPPQHDDEIGRLARYRILKQLGAGGMGMVFLAEDTDLQRRVALKVMLPEAANREGAGARFLREARLAASIKNDHIVTIYQVGEDRGVPFLAMEVLDGVSLDEWMRQNPHPAPRDILRLGREMALGLAAAHERGLIHRDIKPANIWVEQPNDRVKILDFGLARQAAGGENLTHSGIVLGTPAYMAPEQAEGLAVDARADLFSLGCVLYRLSTGQPAFHGPSVMSILKALATHTPPPVSQIRTELPAQLTELIKRLLAKDSAERPVSARAVADEIAAIESALASTTPAVKTAPEPVRKAAAKVVPQPQPSDATKSIIPASSDSGRHRTLGTAGGKDSTTVHAPPASGASIAVLPFVNMSSDPENEFLSDGLAEELIAVLTKVKGLHVTSRTSAFAFKGKREDVRKIGEQLNVRTVLEGSVRKSGQRLRISAQLVKAADGYQLWSETYNRQMADVFDIQDEIAQSIAKALHVILTEEDMPGAPQRASVEAYEFYLRGRQFFHQFRRQSFEFAEEMFARAIEIDPGYARAYAGIADCRSSLYLNWAATEDNLRRANEASCKALELGPDLAEAHVARALVLSLRKQFAEARGEFETAIRLDPTLFEARLFFGRHCRREGKLLEAAELFEQAWQMRQDDYQSLVFLASIYSGLGRTAEAQATGRRCIAVIEKHLALHPDSGRALCLGSSVWMQLNEPARAAAWAERALAMDPDEPLTLYNIACFYALQKKTDQALDVLERAVQQGFADQELMAHDLDLNSLHGHPRFQALVDRMAKT